MTGVQTCALPICSALNPTTVLNTPYTISGANGNGVGMEYDPDTTQTDGDAYMAIDNSIWLKNSVYGEKNTGEGPDGFGYITAIVTDSSSNTVVGFDVTDSKKFNSIVKLANEFGSETADILANWWYWEAGASASDGKEAPAVMTSFTNWMSEGLRVEQDGDTLNVTGTLKVWDFTHAAEAGVRVPMFFDSVDTDGTYTGFIPYVAVTEDGSYTMVTTSSGNNRPGATFKTIAGTVERITSKVNGTPVENGGQKDVKLVRVVNFIDQDGSYESVKLNIHYDVTIAQQETLPDCTLETIMAPSQGRWPDGYTPAPIS